MSSIYLSELVLITPLGGNPEENEQALRSGKTGITQCKGSGFNQENWYQSKINDLGENRYQDLLGRSLNKLRESVAIDVLQDPKTLFIVSTTKADIQVMPADPFASTYRLFDQLIGPANPLRIISNACISGVVAINCAADLVHTGQYDRVFVLGIDVLSDFITYGFQSLFALSDEPCRPFDAARKGISLGEACGIVCVDKVPNNKAVRYLGGASSNDANHISGPSRTGEGLFRAVVKTLQRGEVSPNEIDFISAHGTATLYNDDMESIAFGRLGLTQVPLNSLKGYYGHTLGAAGIVETIVSLFSLRHGILYASPGYETQGTTEALTIIRTTSDSQLTTVLKTASGFGGGNAALLIRRMS